MWKTVTIAQLRDNMDQLLHEVIHHHEPLEVLEEEGSLIIMPKEDWDSLQETLYLYGVPGAVDRIKEGLKQPREECINLDDVEW